MSLENPLVAFESTIIAACGKHERENRMLPEYRRLIRFDDYYVKFGDSKVFSSEVQTHDYFAKVTEKDLTAPRVPLIRHTFQHAHLTFAVIEPIQTVPVARDVFVQKVADAVLWMRSQACPAGVALGPLGSGPIWHAIFKNKYAPLLFTSVVALEKFLNVAVSTMQRRIRPELANINISGERLVLTQSDMHSSNFAVDTTGRVVIFDFGEIGWLPESLANYTLLLSVAPSGVAARVLGDQLDSVRASSNTVSLRAVKIFLGMGSNTTLGLDNDGNPKSASDLDVNVRYAIRPMSDVWNAPRPTTSSAT